MSSINKSILFPFIFEVLFIVHYFVSRLLYLITKVSVLSIIELKQFNFAPVIFHHALVVSVGNQEDSRTTKSSRIKELNLCLKLKKIIKL